MKLQNLTSILFKSLAIVTMMLALLAQPIIESIDMIWDTQIELSDLESQQEQEEEQQEKDTSDEKVELFAFNSHFPRFYNLLGNTEDYTHEIISDFSLEITIPPPRIYFS